MRVLVAEPLADEGLELLRAEHEVDVRTGLTREEFLAALPDYEALLVRSQVKVDAEAIAAGTKLARHRPGRRRRRQHRPRRRDAAGITVVNAPTGNTIAAAEHTLALLLALARRIAGGGRVDARAASGSVPRSSGRELRGKTLGIIGLGKIGMAVAERARAHGDGRCSATTRS